MYVGLNGFSNGDFLQLTGEQFCDEPPEGFVSLHAAMRRLGVSRQRVWQRIRSGELEARNIRRGPVKGLYVRVGQEDSLPLFDDTEPNNA